MRKTNLLGTLLILGTSLFSFTSVVAEELITSGISLTHKIVNPGFDSNTLEGWTVEGKTGAASFNVMEVFSGEFNAYQTITGLPAGAYELSVSGFHRAGVNDSGSAYGTGTEVINAALYASASGETKETVLPSLYSVKDFVVTGTGRLLNGYVDNMEGASQAFAAGHYTNVTVKNIVVTDGTLTIGVKTLGTNVDRSWTIWDNFQLMYVGEGNLAIYREMIDQIDQKLNDYKDEGLVPSGITKDIEGVQASKDEFYYSEDQKELETLLNSYRQVESSADHAAAVMDSLFSQINLAASLEDEHYPGEDALEAARIKSTMLTSFGATTEEGNPVYAQDLSRAISEIKTAIITYRFSQTPSAQGLDCTWAMKAPNFTKEGGDTSLLTDASFEGWVTNSVFVSSDFRLNLINGKNCWNNFSNNFTSMDVYQELENLPMGLYSFSCYQTNDGPTLTDQHAYITAMGGTSESPAAAYSFALDDNPDKGTFVNAQWEGPISTGKVLVGSDGKLRVGFASTSNKNGSSGWFCITDCRLIYYGMESGAYEEALQTMIEEAKDLQYFELLPVEARALEAGIQAAEEIDPSDNEAAEAGLKVLSEVIAVAKEASAQVTSFKNGVYANVAAVEENGEGLYSETIQDFASGVLEHVNVLFEVDTTSNAVLPLLTDQLNQCLSMLSLIQRTETVIANNLYSQEPRNQLSALLTTQLNKVKADLSLVSQAESVIGYELKMTTLSGGVDPVNGADVTIWIQNPDFENTVWNNGWSANDFKVSTTLQDRDDFYSGNTAETWIGGGKILTDRTISQTMYVPNGTYSLSVVATACQQGTLTYYEEDGTTVKETVTLTTPVKGVWLFASEDSIEIATPMIGESAPYENQTVNNEPHSELFRISSVQVKDNTLTFGVKIRSTTANWVALDTFKLTCLNYAVGVNDIDADQDIPVVYEENGLIRVMGTDEYEIYTINGIRVPGDVRLTSGIYLVKTCSQVIKVMIK